MTIVSLPISKSCIALEMGLNPGGRKTYWPPGTRVRAKVRSMAGWKGKGTVANHLGDVLPDGKTEPHETVCGMPYEWARLRDQTPNPKHQEALAYWSKPDDR